MTKVLVTGGCGFIGHYLVKHLLKNDYQVSVFDNQARGKVENLKDVMNDIDYHQGDIRNLGSLMEAAQGCDTIIHLAFINGTKNFYSMPSDVIDVGIRGLLNVYDAARSLYIKDLLIASSSEAYQKPSIIPTPEDVPLVIPDVKNPRYSYGGTKIMYELMAQHYERKYFDRVVTFRPHNVYGKNMGQDHVIPELIKKIESSENNLELLGDGSQTRAFCHINDFCDAMTILLERGVDGEIYNIGTDQEVTIGQLAESLLLKMNSDLKLTYSESPKGETNRRCPDINLLKNLGYKSKINLNDGLDEVLK